MLDKVVKHAKRILVENTSIHLEFPYTLEPLPKEITIVTKNEDDLVLYLAKILQEIFEGNQFPELIKVSDVPHIKIEYIGKEILIKIPMVYRKIKRDDINSERWYGKKYYLDNHSPSKANFVLYHRSGRTVIYQIED